MTNPVTPVTISPTIVDRPAQQYVGTTRTVTMTSIGLIADRLPEILNVLLAQGQAPAGPPFLRYLAIRDDMSELEVEAGWPVASGVDLSADSMGLHGGELPAGQYVTVTHHGHPDGLLDVNAGVLQWALARGLAWDAIPDGDRQRWGCRLESYLTDPRVEPDLNSWDIELALRLAD